MSEPTRIVSVKLHPVARPQPYLYEGAPGDAAPRPGQQIVVHTDAGPAVGTVVPTIAPLAERKRPPAESANRVVRLATHEDIVARLRQQQREKEAYRIATLKVRERGLQMKLT